MFVSITLLVSMTMQAEVDFARQVHPILTARCAACHTGDKAQAGLDVNSRRELLRGGSSGPAIVPGNGRGSLLLQRIMGAKEPRMPMRGAPLGDAEIELISKWVDEGAKASDAAVPARWIAPLKPRTPAVPPGAKHPVDAFLNATGDPVPDSLFARRVYLDLWGLLPTPEQLAEFEKDAASDKRAKLIDRLLRHEKNYAGHWISYWNDLLRNDDGVTYHGERKSITPWLRAALESNMPYDRFVAELLNPKPKKGPEGFILGVGWRGEVPASERPPLQAAQNSAQTFLGINLKCNSCHDSFISNWKLRDAYGLASFFTPEPLEMIRCDNKTGEIAKPKFLFPELGDPKASDGDLEERRADAARFFTMPENGRLTRTVVNRYWKRLLGRGLVEPVDDMSAEPYHPDLLDWLASDLAAHGYDLKHLLRTILTSRAYQLPSVDTEPKAGERYTFRGPQKRRLTAEQFADAVAAITGEWRPYPSNSPTPTYYAREWQLKSTRLTRALGRPVRDQVVTQRLDQPTTLEALELVNGPQLAGWLQEGARRLVGETTAAPENLYDSGLVRRNPAPVDIDIHKARKLYLLVENVDSYDVRRVTPQWRDAVLIGRNDKPTPLAELVTGVDLEKLALPSRIEVTLPEKGYKRLKATAGVDKASLASDVGPAIRFYVFDQPPDPKRLAKVDGYTPVTLPGGGFTSSTLVDRVYRHALQREPAEAERAVARQAIGDKLSASGVEDLLWMVLMSAEFQYIR